MALVVFVCTGNICRSAMAEGIARHRLEVPGVLEFQSAGTWHVSGPATPEAVAAAAEVGVDIDDHRARPLSEHVVRRADRVYGMTRQHVDAVERLGGRAELLAPEGTEIADPYGGTMTDYRRARDAVSAAIAARSEGWRALGGG